MAKNVYVPLLWHCNSSLTFLCYMRGGYIADQVRAWLEGQRNTMQDRVLQVYKATVEHFFLGGSEDDSAPLRWSGPLAGTATTLAGAVAGKASQVQLHLTAKAAAVYSATFPFMQQFCQLIFSEYSTTSCNTELQRQLVG